MPGTLPDYAILDEQLRAAGAAIAPAELHGVVCGLICASGREAAADWIAQQAATFSGPGVDVEATVAALDELEGKTWSALNGSQLQFEPVLPDDDSDLGERAAALGQWCHGFVGGLVLGGWTDGDNCDPDVLEIVGDFSAISNVGIAAADDDGDAGETSFFELAEYVRVGAQLVFESLAAHEESPTIH